MEDKAFKTELTGIMQEVHKASEQRIEAMQRFFKLIEGREMEARSIIENDKNLNKLHKEVDKMGFYNN